MYSYRTEHVAAVVVRAGEYPSDQPYSYLIPDHLYRPHLTGCRVVVPLGRGNRRVAGLIICVSDAFPDEVKGLKPVIVIADREPVVNEEQLKLLEWLRDNYFCTYYDGVRTLLPLALQLNVREHFELRRDGDTEHLSEGAAQFYAMLSHARSRQEFDALLEAYETPDKIRFRNELLEAGIVRPVQEVQDRVKNKTVRMVRLCGAQENASLSDKQQQVVTALMQFGEIAEKELCYMCSCTNSVIAGLVKRGQVERFDSLPGEDYPLPAVTPPPLVLSAEQQAVYDRVVPFIERKEARCFLLHGVTGSGKTAVFEALIARTLEEGRSVLMLLPEIGLTPQTVRRFHDRFGGAGIAVVHSGLTLRERRRSYERAQKGEAKLVIGTRSAVFSPLPDIGLIIMDEEGERSYKSEQTPRYDTIQVARQRCRYHGAVLLPASATPTLESYYLSEKGVYERLTMKHRYSANPLPAVETVDMNLERAQGNDSEFSTALTQALRENIDRGEQSILLLNRRGYHTIMSCCTCNQPVYCESCSVPMTYHKSDNNLHCHYCGSIRQLPEKCPACGGPHMRRMGFGTQRLEDELSLRFPDARILRMDADTTASRNAYEKGFEAFRRGEYDILLGTQMIGKGLDFPNVTLVGVLSVDRALFSGDFRSYERTFSLITQVVGRGGRSAKPGRAILQTFMPDHYVLRLAAAQDYERFCQEEFSLRRQLLLPPFCDICVIGLTGEKTADVVRGAECFVRCLREALQFQKGQLPLRVLGPVPCTYEKINGRYRYRIIIKCKNTETFREYLKTAMRIAAGCQEMAKVRCFADMNGNVGI